MTTATEIADYQINREILQKAQEFLSMSIECLEDAGRKNEQLLKIWNKMDDVYADIRIILDE